METKWSKTERNGTFSAPVKIRQKSSGGEAERKCSKVSSVVVSRVVKKLLSMTTWLTLVSLDINKSLCLCLKLSVYCESLHKASFDKSKCH